MPPRNCAVLPVHEIGSPGALPKKIARVPMEVIPRAREYQYRVSDLDEKQSRAKSTEETANKAADDPKTAILSGVCPTPRTKNSGIIPSRLDIVNRVVKDRTPT